MNNNSQECTDENCITCSLVEEFSLMVKDGVNWENALRHVLDVAFTQDNEMISDLMDETYSTGFHDGIMFGVEQSQKALDNVHEFMASKIADDEATFEAKNDEYDDEIEFEEDDTKEVTADDIQAIIKNDKK